MTRTAPTLARDLPRLLRLHKLRNTIRGMTELQLIDALYRDEATGLLNRRAFAASMSQQIAIVDLDSLKWVNDHHGHEAGDRLLLELAGWLVQEFGEARCYRLAGDEFVVRGDDATEIIGGLKRARAKFQGFSFGVGRTLAEADAALRFEKDLRETRGERAPRGERPPHAIAA